MQSQIPFVYKYASFSIVVMSLLFPYYFPGTNIPLDTILILLNAILFFILGQINAGKYIRISYPNSYLYFLVYSLIIPVFGFLLLYNDFSAFLSSYKTILPFTVCYIYSIPFLRFSLIRKYYRLLVLITCSIFLLQDFMFMIVGYRFSALLPFLPVRYADISTATFMSSQMFAPRSSSMFLEPAHFAQFVLGYLAIILGENSNRNKFFTSESVLLTLILIITMSGNAIILLALLWLVFFVKSNISKIRKYLIILPISVIIILVGISYISSTEQGEHLLSRTEELQIEQDRLSSGMIRIFRGYFVYSDMPFWEQVTGVGGGFGPHVIENSSFFWMFYDYERYLNNIQIILLGSGMIGFILFMCFLIKLAKIKNRISLMFVLLFLGLSFIEYFWCTGKMILYLSIPLLLYNTERYNSLEHENNSSSLRHSS